MIIRAREQWDDPSSEDKSAALQQVLSLVDQYHAAMVAGDCHLLNGILTKDFELVHITGYAQSKQEWFDVLNACYYMYHQIDLGSPAPTIDLVGQDAVLEGIGEFDATIAGYRHIWRMKFSIHLSPSGLSWRLRRAAYRLA